MFPSFNLRNGLRAVLSRSVGLTLLIALAIAAPACAAETAPPAEVTSKPAWPAAAEVTRKPAHPLAVSPAHDAGAATPAPSPEPTVDIPATIITTLTRVAPMPTPTPVPDVPATAAALLRELLPTPTPEPAERSISDVVRSIDAGLYRINTPDSTGSGFLVSDQGHIVTNAHVVGEHLSVTVRSAAGELSNARVLGKNDRLDLAVVQTKRSHHSQPMTLGDASDIRPGDKVIALGFPLGDQLGQDYTVTEGIVSALRVRDSVERIQTDAAINPGSSGGPLINLDGEVIGVNTSTLVDYVDISFAISIAEVKASLDSLISGEEVKNRWQTYENDDCRYSLAVYPDWILNEGAEPCQVNVERYVGDVLVGTVNVSADQLSADETLGDFAMQWRDSLVEQSRHWKSFNLVSFDRVHVSDEGYLFYYSWQETDADCLFTGTAMIVQSNHVPKALVFSAGACHYAPDAVLEEVTEMDLRY